RALPDRRNETSGRRAAGHFMTNPCREWGPARTGLSPRALGGRRGIDLLQRWLCHLGDEDEQGQRKEYSADHIGRAGKDDRSGRTREPREYRSVEDRGDDRRDGEYRGHGPLQFALCRRRYLGGGEAA